MKKIAFILSGVIGIVLGGLWLLQGLGLVHMAPILCFADCVPLEEPSLTWTVIGCVIFIAGGVALLYALKRSDRR